jgi:glycosyltransferase involved in cell wall biosynthesis
MPRSVVHALHGGGAERVAAAMADQWAGRGDRVTVVTLDTVSSDVFTVDPRVRRIGLGLMRKSRHAWQAIRHNVTRIRALRHVLRESVPQCVVSVTDRMNVLTLLACRGLGAPVVIAEHSDPRHQRMGTAWELLRKRSYPHCAAAVVLTQPVAETMKCLVKGKPVFVIPNGVRVPDATDSVPEQAGPTILAMGRLSPEKGFDLLVQAFAQLAGRHTDWTLAIAGEGPRRSMLEQQIAQLGLSDRVRLLGWVSQPYRLMRQARLFVLSSRYEGFPVALLEAMACGLPAVSFDCDSGPREIIRHELDGLLVPPGDVSALAGAIERLLRDDTLRAKLAHHARDVVQRFSQQSFAAKWEEVLQRCLAPS